eukprot:5862818-Amphidinium_carterae.1
MTRCCGAQQALSPRPSACGKILAGHRWASMEEFEQPWKRLTSSHSINTLSPSKRKARAGASGRGRQYSVLYGSNIAVTALWNAWLTAAETVEVSVMLKMCNHFAVTFWQTHVYQEPEQHGVNRHAPLPIPSSQRVPNESGSSQNFKIGPRVPPPHTKPLDPCISTKR